MMKIDSHLHLWVNDPDNYPWQPIGGYTPDEDADLAQYLEVMAAQWDRRCGVRAAHALRLG